ncbi:MAG TPA: serine hydrolase [Bryobacteraceae bacterium]|jgi:CubicO group peptidase (beta-lactamase class C family)/leucyl aminopeptidase (aminopeptidase T)
MFAHSTFGSFLRIAAATLLLSTAAFAQTLNTAKIDSLAEAALQAWHAPGCAIAIIEGNRVVYAKGYGVKELGKPDRVTTKTVFAIGSTTKAFTTAVLAMLNDEGRLAWDDPVRKYLPDFQLADPAANELVTIRDLVTHRTGLSRNDVLWYGSPMSRAEILHAIGRVPLTEPFRSAWQYQNMMFLAAGQVAGSAGHSSWEELVRHRILDPLEMRSTSLTTWDIPATADRATPHVKREGKVQTTAWRNLDDIGPAGAINSNVEDLSTWLRLQMNDGVAPGGKRLISSKNMREMHTPQMAMRPEEWGRNFTDETNQMAYGLGWFLQDYRGHHVVNHGGAIDGFRANFSMLPNEHVGVIVLANLGDDNMPEALRWSILDSMFGAKFKDWNAFLMARGAAAEAAGVAARAEREKMRKTGTNPSLALESYAGWYKDSAYGTAHVIDEEGKLFIDWNGSRPALEHFHYDTFSALDSLVTFHLDEAAAVASLDFLGRTFERTAPPYDPVKVAARITGQLKLRAEDHVIIRVDPGYMADLTEPLKKAVEQAGAHLTATLPYIPMQASAGDRELATAKLRLALKDANVYLWMPFRTDARDMTDNEAAQLVEWLKLGGVRREIHFHWNGGTVLADGLPAVHQIRFDKLYADALDIDYARLSAAQSKAAAELRKGTVRVRTPAGTDIVFRIGATRPFNQQDGDASAARMSAAKVQVDREIELPAGVLRVAPLEETANGVIVIPEGRFGDQKTRMLRLRIAAGKVVEVTAEANEAAARAAIFTSNIGDRSFREFGLGFNPKLTQSADSPVLPYFAYGSGMVRMSLGDNQELGGNVRTGGERRWFFFPDATVETEGRVLVDRGHLTDLQD